MLIDINEIHFENIAYFYDKYYLGDELIQTILDVAEAESTQEALDIFSRDYIGEPTKRYQDLITQYLGYASDGPLSKRDESKIIQRIGLLSIGLIALLLHNFRTYIHTVELPVVSKREGLKKADIKRAIFNDIITKYEQTITSAATNIQTFAINSIRSMQKNIIIENIFLRGKNYSKEKLAQVLSEFKANLGVKYPKVFSAIKNGNIVPVPSGDGRTRHYKFDYYVDMVTRNIVTNVNRDVIESMALLSGERAVEYVVIDPRKVKDERVICKHILNNLVFGKSILALDIVTATALGVMTVDEARSTPDFAMGIYCRHGLRRLDKAYIDKINTYIEEKVKSA